MIATPEVSAEYAADATRLLQLHALAVAADKRNAQRGADLTSAHLQESFDAHEAHTVACEQFRRKYHPGAYRVVAVFDDVIAVSRTARSTRLLFTKGDAR